jgi:hypothetical protein
MLITLAVHTVLHWNWIKGTVRGLRGGRMRDGAARRVVRPTSTAGNSKVRRSRPEAAPAIAQDLMRSLPPVAVASDRSGRLPVPSAGLENER